MGLCSCQPAVTVTKYLCWPFHQEERVILAQGFGGFSLGLLAWVLAPSLWVSGETEHRGGNRVQETAHS